MAVEDRPREKLLEKGKETLTNSELIAILIGSGTRNVSAIQVAQNILALCNNNLKSLGRLNVAELSKIPGIGNTKAITIIAAIELGRRRQLCDAQKLCQIKSSHDAYQYLHPILGDLNHEEFWALYLNRNNRIVASERISKGGVTGTVADIKIIFKRALELLSSSIIVAHNHPSGNLTPSQADINVTKKINQSSAFLEIKLLDHLIVTEGGYYSFSDEGLI